MQNANDLAERYVALWNESDAGRRRELVRALWTEGGAQVLRAPEELRERADQLGMDATLRARGHEALEERARRAYEEFVADGGYVFRLLDGADRLDEVLKLRWEMVPAAGGDAAGSGLEVMLLGPDGRIRIDYQFID